MNIFDSRNLLHVLLWNLFKDEVGATIVILETCFNYKRSVIVEFCFSLVVANLI